MEILNLLKKQKGLSNKLLTENAKIKIQAVFQAKNSITPCSLGAFMGFVRDLLQSLHRR
jgi:hypothetical protein